MSTRIDKASLKCFAIVTPWKLQSRYFSFGRGCLFQFHSGVAAGGASMSSTASMSAYCTSVQH